MRRLPISAEPRQEVSGMSWGLAPTGTVRVESGDVRDRPQGHRSYAHLLHRDLRFPSR